jgi:hypothetical protein
MADYNPLAGVGSAQLFERGKFLHPGRYTLEVVKTILKHTRKSGDAFIVEFEVLETTDDEKHPVGTKATWFQKLSDTDIAFPAIKDFMRNLMGIDLNDKAAMLEFSQGVDGLLGKSINEPETLKGNRIKVECYMTRTKGKGLDFTVHQWSPCDPDETDDGDEEDEAG